MNLPVEFALFAVMCFAALSVLECSIYGLINTEIIISGKFSVMPKKFWLSIFLIFIINLAASLLAAYLIVF